MKVTQHIEGAKEKHYSHLKSFHSKERYSGNYTTILIPNGFQTAIYCVTTSREGIYLC
jgi:hypothetical protein